MEDFIECKPRFSLETQLNWNWFVEVLSFENHAFQLSCWNGNSWILRLINLETAVAREKMPGLNTLDAETRAPDARVRNLKIEVQAKWICLGEMIRDDRDLGFSVLICELLLCRSDV